MNKRILQTGIKLSAALCYMAGTIWSGTLVSSMTINIIWVGSIFISFILSIQLNNGRLSIEKGNASLYIWLTLFCGICFASVLWAHDASLAKNKALFIIRIALSIGVLTFVLKDIDSLLETIELGGHFAVLAYIAVNGISLVLTKMRIGSRLGDAGLNGNALGMAAMISIMIGIYFILKNGLSIKNLLLVPSVLIVIISQSRKAIVSLFGGVLLLLFLNSMRKKQFVLNMAKILLYLMAGIGAVYLIMNLPFLSFVKDRLEGMITELYGSNTRIVDSSTYVRMALKQYGRDMFLSNPIMGVGLDNARLFNPYGVYLHDNYLEMLANLGIIGFVIYYFPYAIAGIRYIKYRDVGDRQYNICLVLLIILLFVEFGRVTYYNLNQYILLIAIRMKSQQIRNAEKNKLTT